MLKSFFLFSDLAALKSPNWKIKKAFQKIEIRK